MSESKTEQLGAQNLAVPYSPVRHGQLARKVVLAVTLAGIVVLFFGFWANLALEYRKATKDIGTYLHEVETSDLPSLTLSAWTANMAMAQSQLDALTGRAYLDYAELTLDNGMVLRSGKPASESEEPIRRSYPLIHEFEGKQIKIGDLVLEAGYEDVQARVRKSALLLLATHGLSVAISVGLIVLIFHFLIHRRLQAMSAYAQNMTENNLGQPLVLDNWGSRNAGDELSQLAKSMNFMRENLRQSLMAVRENEERLRVLFAAVSDPVLVADRDTGILVECNEAAERYFGRSREQLIGQPQSVLHPPDTPQIEGMTEDFRRKLIDPMYSEEVTLLAAGGELRRVEVTARKFEIGESRLLLGVFRDITDRKNVEDSLRESKERFERVLRGTNDGYWDWDLDTNRVFFSDRWKEIIGYAPQELNHDLEEWSRRVHPEDLERVMAENELCLRGEKPGFRVEYRLRHKDGTYRWILSRGSSTRDEDGRVLLISGAHTDITEMKRAEESLHTAAEVIAQIPSGLFVYQFSPPDRLYLLESNPEAQRLTGVSAADMAGKEFDEIWPNAKELGIKTQFLTPFSTGERYETATVVYQDEHISGVYRIRTFLLSRDRLGVSFEEVTARYQAERSLVEATEKAHAASRAKSDFLANMSHEIRTPLNGVLGMLQAIRACEIPGDVETYAEMGIRAGQRLTSLLGDILDLSRIEAGRMPIRSEPFTLANIFTALAETFSPLHYSKPLTLLMSPSPDIPTEVLGDEVRVRQVLFNLVGNAMKFTDMGEVQMAVTRLLPLPTGQIRLLFAVSDTGPGIPDEKIDQICTPFVQVSSDFTRSHQGAGLGLSIARRLVDAMGGTLTFESTEGQGTTAYLVLPFSLPEPADYTAPNEPKLKAAPSVSLRLLLVEDEEISRLSARLALEKRGHTVDTANNGEEAIEALQASRYDCVLMDIQMDVMDGLSATRWIRSGNSGVLDANVPIIAMTAYAMAGDREIFLEAGMNDYVAKPVMMEELQKVLSRVLGLCPVESERNGQQP